MSDRFAGRLGMLSALAGMRVAEPGAGPLRLPAAVRLLRPHHWVKNAIVAAPLLLYPADLSLANLRLIMMAVLSFCLLASTVYVINDVCDRHADRAHPVKRFRPIASGAVSLPLALAIAAVTLLAGLGVGLWLSPGFAGVGAAYFAINLAYSFGLKNVSILDVMIIALGFVLRMVAGTIAIGVTAGVWVMICVGLAALFLALAKRRDDVVRALDTGHRKSLAGYNKLFLDTSIAVVLGALLVAYVIYTTNQTAVERFGTPDLYLTMPFVLAGILRYLQITLVEERSGAPTVILLTDRFMIGSVLCWAISFALLVHL